MKKNRKRLRKAKKPGCSQWKTEMVKVGDVENLEMEILGVSIRVPGNFVILQKQIMRL